MILQLTNEALTAIIVIVSTSMLLYNLTRNLQAPVARASSVLLACVTISYTVDSFTSLDPTTTSLQTWLRLQWIAIAFSPAAMFHLSDALLATTGLVSRGRRRRVVRILYAFSLLFLILAAFSDTLVHGLVDGPAPHMSPGPVFPLYVTFVVLATLVSVYNVMRARQRCLTTYTYRRMGYLLYSFAMPALGIFPYSLLFLETGSSPILFWLLVNLGNMGIALMLLFMAYPLAFFGSNIPDRVIKSRLLDFFLRGPFTGIIVLMIILYLPSNQLVFGITGRDIMPFVAVASVMFWQWMVSLFSPSLERLLVYANEQQQIRMIQSVSQRLLTQNDLEQLLESILAGVCDLLQVPTSFVAVLEGDQVRVEQSIGRLPPNPVWPSGSELNALFEDDTEIASLESLWIVPLYGEQNGVPQTNGLNGAAPHRLLGILGIRARSEEPDLSAEECEGFDLLIQQAAQALDDRRLQTEVFAALEGLMPDIEALQRLRDVTRYGNFSALGLSEVTAQADTETAAFVGAVRDALRDYWGGPRLTQSPLLQLAIAHDALPENDDNPTRALRAVLLEAINRLKPSGERNMTRAEWTLYNIIELRFIQGLKVRDVARRLSMSEADMYRKQRSAIEEVARVLAEMETAHQQKLTQAVLASPQTNNPV